MIDRRDLGSWVQGPGGPRAPRGDYRGAALGLPESGPGALAGFGRRFGAVLVDWFSSLLVARLLFPDLGATSESIRSYDPSFSFVVLGIFFLQRVLLTWLGGSSFGQRIFGSAVVRLDGSRAGLGRVALRTFLLCLVVPLILTDGEGRGLHDRLAGTMELNAR